MKQLFIRLVQAVEEIAKQHNEANGALRLRILDMERRLEEHIAAKRHVSTARRRREAAAPILEQESTLDI